MATAGTLNVVARFSRGQQDLGAASSFAALSPFIVNNLHFRRGSWKTVFLGSHRLLVAALRHEILDSTALVPVADIRQIPQILTFPDIYSV